MADRSIVYRLQADISQFRAQMAQAGASVRKAADDMTSATKSGTTFRAGLDTVGRSAGKAGLVAAAGLGAAAKAAIDWETAWAGVTKTTDGTATQMAALEDQLRNLARTMPATHEEIAATAEAAGQLGVARENVASFTKTMLMLGETTNLTADQAATSIAQIANVMQTAPDDIDNFGAALVALGNNGATCADLLRTQRPQLQALKAADWVFVSVGVNDVTQLSTAHRWRARLQTLLQALTEHSPQAQILLAGVPPMGQFPGLPMPLRQVFGWRAARLDSIGQGLAATVPQVLHLATPVPEDPSAFASDGYHPNAESCRVWAEAVAANSSQTG